MCVMQLVVLLIEHLWSLNLTLVVVHQVDQVVDRPVDQVAEQPAGLVADLPVDLEVDLLVDLVTDQGIAHLEVICGRPHSSFNSNQ